MLANTYGLHQHDGYDDLCNTYYKHADDCELNNIDIQNEDYNQCCTCYVSDDGDESPITYFNYENVGKTLTCYDETNFPPMYASRFARLKEENPLCRYFIKKNSGWGSVFFYGVPDWAIERIIP